MSKIPSAIIGVLSQALPDFYTHDGINGLFLTASAPDSIPEGSKSNKVTTWLRAANNQCQNPLEVLSNILSDIMDKEPNGYNNDALQEAKLKIQQTLAKDSLKYMRGGYITRSGATPTQTLEKQAFNRGLEAVDTEIKRALDNVEKDPPAAISAAGNILETVFKNYLEHHKVAYSDKDTLKPLWEKVASHMGIRQKIEHEELAKIVSGLNKIVDGIIDLRNGKSSSHGKSESQIKAYTILPRHARLAIHSAHTISAYLLELIDGEQR
jgi:hypothetical protein